MTVTQSSTRDCLGGTDPNKISSITELSADIRGSRISSVSIVEAALERIERLNPNLNAFVHVAYEDALAQAARMDKEVRDGRYRGPLHGIPVAVKDNVDTGDMPTTNGSRFFIDNRPAGDAKCVDNLRRSGAIIIGKTLTSEFALGPTGEFSVHGRATNPHDFKRVTGGSSAGSACAVAAGMVPASVGTDTGGSIRIPSSFCGVVGLKPTYGFVSTRGVFPVSTSLDHVGPIAGNSQDAALLLAALRGDTLPGINWHPESPRVGWLDVTELVEVDNDVFHAVREQANRMFKSLIRDVELPRGLLSQAKHASREILLAEANSVHAERIRDRHIDFCAPVAARLTAAAGAPAWEYVSAQSARAELQRTFEEVFRKFDLLLLPTTPITAPFAGEPLCHINSTPQPVGDVAGSLTSSWNYLGFPSASIPAGDIDGLPVGLQAVARRGADYWLLSLLHARSTAV